MKPASSNACPRKTNAINPGSTATHRSGVLRLPKKNSPRRCIYCCSSHSRGGLTIESVVRHSTVAKSHVTVTIVLLSQKLVNEFYPLLAATKGRPYCRHYGRRDSPALL